MIQEHTTHPTPGWLRLELGSRLTEIARLVWFAPRTALDAVRPPRFYESSEHLTPQYLARVGVYFARGMLLTLVLAAGISLMLLASMHVLQVFSPSMLPYATLPLIAPVLLFLSWHLLNRARLRSEHRHQAQVATATVLLAKLSRVAVDLSPGELERLAENLMRLKTDGTLPSAECGATEYFLPVVYRIEQAGDAYQLVRRTPKCGVNGGMLEERWTLNFRGKST